MECDIIFCHFGSFFPFHPTIECKKMPGDIILLNMSNIQEDHMMYGLWDKRQNEQFLVILGHCLPFDPPNNPKK